MRQRPHYSRAPQQEVVPRQLAERLVRERESLQQEINHLKAQEARMEAAIRRQAEEKARLTAQLQDSLAHVRALEHTLHTERTEPELAPAEAVEHSDTDRVQRLSADLANLRRRQDEHIQRTVRHDKRAVLQEMLVVRDTLSQALDSSTDRTSAWFQGTVGVLRQFDDVLRRQGLHRIGDVGEPFDPTHHEAVAMTDQGTPGTVVQVARHGFAFEDGDLIRPAQVVVAKED